MNRSSLSVLVLAATMALLVVVPGCDDDDDVTSLPADQIVEAGLNSALQTTVVPLVTFMGTIGDFLTAAPAVSPRGLNCPDTSSWCAAGTVVCSVTGTGYHFDFDECSVDTEDALLLDGDVDAAPAGSTVGLTFTNLFINNQSPISGTGSIDTVACDYTVDVSTDDAGIVGTVTSCDADPWPTGDQLLISVDDYLMTITLDGSQFASVFATQGGTPVANCIIDLDSQPLTSVCEPY